MNSSLVSVIMPVYNTKDYLDGAICSVLAQDHPQWELLAVDDGSTDGSAELLDRYAGQDARIRVFHQKNGGVSSARNRALSEVRGDFVCFLDSDDAYEPHYLSSLLEMWEKSGHRPVCCGFTEVRQDGESAACRPMPERDVLLDDFLSEALIGRLNLSIVCFTWLFPSETACRIRFHESIRYGEDSLYICELLNGFERVFYDPVPLYRYRIDRAGNTVTEQSFRKCDSGYRALKEMYRLYRGSHPKTEQVLVKNLLERAAAASRAAGKEGLKAEQKKYRRAARACWKKLLGCQAVSRHDKIRLLSYALSPMLSEKLMLRLYGRV